MVYHVNVPIYEECKTQETIDSKSFLLKRPIWGFNHQLVSYRCFHRKSRKKYLFLEVQWWHSLWDSSFDRVLSIFHSNLLAKLPIQTLSLSPHSSLYIDGSSFFFPPHARLCSYLFLMTFYPSLQVHL